MCIFWSTYLFFERERFNHGIYLLLNCEFWFLERTMWHVFYIILQFNSYFYLTRTFSGPTYFSNFRYNISADSKKIVSDFCRTPFFPHDFRATIQLFALVSSNVSIFILLSIHILTPDFQEEFHGFWEEWCLDHSIDDNFDKYDSWISKEHLGRTLQVAFSPIIGLSIFCTW